MKNIMYMLDLLRDGSKTTNIPGLHVVLMWIILIMPWFTLARMSMHS